MSLIEFGKDGKSFHSFSGKQLLKGETDGSSYPNGGLRSTHTAGAYLSIDTSSPIFLRDDCIFIPACLVSFDGYALDEKLPLLRAEESLSIQGCRLLKLLGYHVNSISTMIGLEQELFLVPRGAYSKRTDLQLAGRTVLGRIPPRGQDLCDHYMGPLSLSTSAYACMKEIQEQAYALGIPLKTRHREVAPNQFEFAPLYGNVTTQTDQNLLVMQLAEEIASKHDLAALFDEKPFEGVNGSGKHNNWSICTDDGCNLLNVEQLAQKSGSREIFPIILAAIVKAINDNGDLMRMAISSSGNDFRLGACEAPPSIISTYLGDQMTKYLEGYKNGEDVVYNPTSRLLNFGPSCVPSLNLPAEDRNRTSPFPYGGHRFEFRAVGSSQNVSLVNTVLATICAKAFSEFADAIESGRNPRTVAQESLKCTWKTIFNGDGYDPDNQKRLTDNGLWRFDSGVDAICRYTEKKNVDLFQQMNVMSENECKARQSIMLTQYIGKVKIEALCMRDMIMTHVIPSMKAAGVGNIPALYKCIDTLDKALAEISTASEEKVMAHMSRKLRLETMSEIRKTCDTAESLCPPALWTLATYKDLLFLDSL
jgi:glutamine synthetase